MKRRLFFSETNQGIGGVVITTHFSVSNMRHESQHILPMQYWFVVRPWPFGPALGWYSFDIREWGLKHGDLFDVARMVHNNWWLMKRRMK